MARKYPDLVPKWACKTDIVIEPTDGETEEGAPNFTGTLNVKCNFQNKSQILMTDSEHGESKTAKAFFNGDILPESKAITGYATVYGERYIIAGYERARNPDGTVNYTKLALKYE